MVLSHVSLLILTGHLHSFVANSLKTFHYNSIHKSRRFIVFRTCSFCILLNYIHHHSIYYKVIQ